MSMPNRIPLTRIDEEFGSNSKPSTRSLRNFYTQVIGTSQGASSNGSGGRQSHFGGTGQNDAPSNLAVSNIGENQATLSGSVNWRVYSGAPNRQVRFRLRQDLTEVYNSGWITASGSQSTFEVTPTGLDPDTTYTWDMQGKNGFLINDPKTTSGPTFDTDPEPATCDPPTNVSAFMNTTTQNLQVSWEDSPDTSVYEIERRVDDGTGWSSWGNRVSGVTSPYTIGCSQVGEDDDLVEFRVRSDCGSGNFSGFVTSNTVTISGCGTSN